MQPERSLGAADSRPGHAAADWQPRATWQMLARRASLLRDVREFFDQEDFLEVETPLLSRDVTVDRHLDPFVTALADDAASSPSERLYLQTSPEFAMKRLLAAHGKAIYQITRAFRRGEVGTLHNPEFTIVEWYRPGDGREAGVALLSRLLERLLGCEALGEVSYRDAFLRHASVDPLTAPVEQFRAVLLDRGIAPPASLSLADRDGWLELLLVELVEPHLGKSTTGRLAPVVLHDYPASQAALARISHANPLVAERFELYINGIELANGYVELLDAEVLVERNKAQNLARAQAGKSQLPEQSRLLDAMRAGLPSCTGVALGLDRLLMLATGATTLADVLAFPIERA